MNSLSLEPEPDDEVRFWRFKDLQRLGIVNSRADYYRKIQLFGFPPAVRLGGGAGIGSAASHHVPAVKRWLQARLVGQSKAPKPGHVKPGNRPRGRPRKIENSAESPAG